MKNTILALSTFFIMISCKQKTIAISHDEIIEIVELRSDEEKNNFLYNLWHLDQNFREGEESKIIAEYGYKSKQHKEWSRQFETNDNEVFQKLEYYLKSHDYPSNPSKYDELSLNAFPIIIGHNHRFESQTRLLPYLYNAYKKGNCPLEDVVWVLGEMHESKYSGKRYKMKSSIYTTEDEFDELTKKLGLNLER